MNILLTGASGQLGTELYPLISRLGTAVAVDRAKGTNPTHIQDLADLNRVEIMLNRFRPDLVINAAAYTAVDQAERDRETAFRLNAELPGRIALWCQRNQRRLVHFSTDYVFDGAASRPYLETDPTCPINTYGESKLAGEDAIVASGCEHLILRTSWVYSTHGKNFVLTMLRLARERTELGVVSDQTGCPTWARSLAKATVSVVEQLQSDNAWQSSRTVYHYCDATVTTWYDFARRIFEQAAEIGALEKVPEMKSIQSAEFPQPASRPAYSVLDTHAIAERFGITAPSLEHSLSACMKEYAQ